MSKNKVLVLIDQMETGGAGRVTSTLLPGLLEKGYEVVLALDNVNAKNFYPVPKEIRQLFIPIKGSIPAGLKQIQLILSTREIIKSEKPDVVIAVTFFPFFYAHFASMGMHLPVIAYDHTSFGRDMGRFINYIRYNLYGKADKLVILTKKDERLLGNKFPNKVVVYNPLTYPVVKHSKKRRKTVLCAGRLDSWDVKGFDRMIEIWSRIAPRHPDWKLQIAGSGASQKVEEIESMIAQSGVEGQIELLGQIQDMPSLYSVTSIFALPSRVEGFPMVLLEAMSQGCVCCSFNMGGAVNEMMSDASGSIIQDNDMELFENELESLINRYPNYENLQESGYQDAGRFTCDAFYDQWDNIIKEVIIR